VTTLCPRLFLINGNGNAARAQRDAADGRQVAVAELVAAIWSTGCGLEKPVSEFYPDHGRNRGVTSRCRACFARHHAQAGAPSLARHA
jgi:hypothetical protein